MPCRRNSSVCALACVASSLPVPGVCAVIEREGLVLIAQRPPGKLLALKWEFPGGKVEAGETPGKAPVRELHEELGIVVEPQDPGAVWVLSHG